MKTNDKQLILARDIGDFLIEKKAEDVILLDLRKANPYFCYFLIASANSNVQLKSLLRELMKKYGSQLPQKFSINSSEMDSGWIILDFIDVVVHLFLEDQRKYYNLERLWGDALQLNKTL